MSIRKELGRLRKKVIRIISDYYLQSADFNGFQADRIKTQLKLRSEDAVDLIRELIRNRQVSITHPGNSSNPYIKAFEQDPIDDQLRALSRFKLRQICVFPTRHVLETIVDKSMFVEKPFTLMLSLGSPQLKHLTFNLDVLEFYRNDPRFYYENTDIDGWIGIRDAYFNDFSMKKHDKVYLKAFGFAIDDDLNRAITVCLRYLSDLSPEHQKRWQSRQLETEYHPHPDYWRTHINGQFPERLSIFSAFLWEIRIINEMSRAMDRVPLFRKVFDERDKPRELTFLIRPTKREYDQFILTLDKLLSDNIDINFFNNDIELEIEIERKNGKVEVRAKASLTILSEWLSAIFTTTDTESISRMIGSFKKVRCLRQHPAHKLGADKYDPKFLHDQRKLMIEVYEGIRILRKIIATHPATEIITIPKKLENGLIWTY